jgi:hypothetical protein
LKEVIMDFKPTLDRVLHAVAATGPLLFFIVALVEGGLRPDYDWVSQPISALALGPRGFVQEVNFAILTVSFGAFAWVCRSAFRHGTGAAAVPLLFASMTLGVGIAGAFPMDAAGAAPTLDGRLHDVGGFLVFPWIPVVVLMLARRFRHDPDFLPYFRYSLVTGGLCLSLLIFFLLFVGPPSAPPRAFSEFRGLVQRTLLLPFFTWMAVVALRAHRLAPAGRAPGGAKSVPVETF